MKVGFGKYKDKSVGALVLKHPHYVSWILSNSNPIGPLIRVKADAVRLINEFNLKPFQINCAGSDCAKPATRCSVYQDNVYAPYWWCNECDPYQAGAVQGKLSAISTYESAISHCDAYHCRKDALRHLIRSLGRAKGLPARVGERQIEEFFVK